MRRLDATLRPLDASQQRYKRADDGDFSTRLTESTQVFVDGKLRVHFEVLPEVPKDLLKALQDINYNVGYRTEGLKVQSRTFGFLPRVTIRRDYCTRSTLALEHPAEAAVINAYGYRADEVYARVNPALYEKHRGLVERVLPCWRMGSSVFTSGIANKDNALFYHLDAGNFPDVWSAMYALSYDCAGGDLAVPELDVGFSFDRPALIFFDGQGLMHGVTPLRKRSKAAYRYSVVYYSLKQLCKCGTPEEELARIRRVKTEREVKRAGK